MLQHQKHTLATRVVHTGLALAILTQLLTSLIFVAPAPDATGNVWFEVHAYGGLTALCFVSLFWLVIVIRRLGTGLGLLFPWFSKSRLTALWTDIRSHLIAIRQHRLPAYETHSPLASAVHGLGLLLVTTMASSGALYYFINTGDPDAGGTVGITMFVHKNLGGVVWVYLIGHAGLAVIYHFTSSLSLSNMWSWHKQTDKVIEHPAHTE